MKGVTDPPRRSHVMLGHRSGTYIIPHHTSSTCEEKAAKRMRRAITPFVLMTSSRAVADAAKRRKTTLPVCMYLLNCGYLIMLYLGVQGY